MWAVTLGRLDITASVMMMSRFRQAPRIGHFQQVKCIFGYLANLPHGAIRYRIHQLDYSDLPHKEYDWARTVYTGAREELPHCLPKPLGKQVTSTDYVDANLHHNLITGKAVTAIKRQSTVETATFVSEFATARNTDDQIIDLHLILMYLGVHINPMIDMFRDNKAVVTNATIPTSTLSKRSHPAAYHRGYLQFHWKDDKSNPDILSNIGDLPPFGLFYSPFFSREEILLTLPPNQRGVTGFQQKCQK